jgi:4'-phosphopantetheinyl transferase
MDVFWLEQSEADVPEENHWLSASEVIFSGRLRFAKRRADWRLGRWTAKRALAACWNLPDLPRVLAKIEIWPELSGAPTAFFERKPVQATISLSHRNGRAISAVAPPAVELGCDLELIEPHSDAFIADYFTPEEQALVARQPATERLRVLALLWSAKESALKALGEGLRLDTRRVLVGPVSGSGDVNGWSPLQVRLTGGQVFCGWWQNRDDTVRTIVAAPPAMSPIPLRNGDLHGSASPFLWPSAVPAAERGGALPIGP